ncbi:Transcriptional regulator marr family [Staphylococcus aureus]|nr:Transcriptional regulator marr family [Staphylococcus aureus]
MRGICDGTYF